MVRSSRNQPDFVRLECVDLDVVDNLCDQAVGEGLKIFESLSLVSFAHEKLKVDGWKTQFEVSSHEPKIGAVAIEAVDTDDKVETVWTEGFQIRITREVGDIRCEIRKVTAPAKSTFKRYPNALRGGFGREKGPSRSEFDSRLLRQRSMRWKKRKTCHSQEGRLSCCLKSSFACTKSRRSEPMAEALLKATPSSSLSSKSHRRPL